MTIWVDADSCPVPIWPVILRASGRTGIPVVFVANRALNQPGLSPDSFVLVGGQPDAADLYIEAKLKTGDLVITRDVKFAKRCLSRKAHVINDRGRIFQPGDIGEIISVGNFTRELMDFGITIERYKGYTHREKKAFADSLDTILGKMRRDHE